MIVNIHSRIVEDISNQDQVCIPFTGTKKDSDYLSISIRLSVLNEFSNPIQIYDYKFVCLQHMLLRDMLLEYLEYCQDQREDENLNYITEILDRLQSIKNYQSFINYYENWLMKPRFDDIKSSYEYCIVSNALDSDIWKKNYYKYMKNAYWILLNEEKGLAISLENYNIECMLDGQLPYLKGDEDKISHMICSLRDEYLNLIRVPLVRDDLSFLVVHILASINSSDQFEFHTISPFVKKNFNKVRRNVRIETILDDTDIPILVSKEEESIELIREYWMKEIKLEIDRSLDAMLYFDFIDEKTGSCFAVVKGVKDLYNEDRKLANSVVDALYKELVKYID